MNLTFRSATITDLDLLKGFEQNLVEYERTVEPTLIPDGELVYYDIPALLQDIDNTVILIAQIDDKPVGCAFGQIRNNDSIYREKQYGYIGFMYVDPAERGKNIARSIIAELVEWFRNRGIQEIRLKVYAGNGGAVAAYEKIGFQPYIQEMKLKTDK